MTNDTITESSGPPAIAPAPTSIALFIGWAPCGPTDRAIRIASFAGYEAAFGKLDDPRSLLGHALGHFFDNGGTDAIALRIVGEAGDFIAPGDAAFARALNAAFAAGGPIETIETFSLICVPGLADAADIAMLQAKAVARRAFLVVDCRENATVANVLESLTALSGTNAANAALYFPWVLAPDSLRGNAPRAFPPCGFVAGVYARTDLARGVWKAPAGTEANLKGALGLTVTVSEDEQTGLNPQGVNALRNVPGGGLVVWGARTLAGAEAQASEWKYVNVRRLMIFVEQSIDAGTKWAAFEPNGEPLWARLRTSISSFMSCLFRDGAFQGSTQQDAWFVKCDATTTTQADIDRGVVNIVVGFAPLKPAEFVIITLAQLAGST